MRASKVVDIEIDSGIVNLSDPPTKGPGRGVYLTRVWVLVTVTTGTSPKLGTGTVWIHHWVVGRGAPNSTWVRRGELGHQTGRGLDP